jgi:hypothetical protein
MVMVRQSLTNAARAGGREALLATTLSEDDVDAAVRGYLGGVIMDTADVEKVVVSITPADFTGITPGTPITVNVSVDFSDVSWLPSSLMHSSGMILSGRSTQRRE